jgi:hypothetical protein
MSSKRSITTIRTVLKTGSTVFGLSALALIVVPGIFTMLLGLYSTPELEWAMRMIGITLVALSGNMYSVAKHGSEKGVLFSGRLMLVAASGLGLITLLIPADHNWFTLGYALVGFGFSAAYAFALSRK